MQSNSELLGDIQDLLVKFREAIFADLKVATIAIVTAIDSKTGLLTVKPAINERVVLPNGDTTWREAPEIPDTPYINPMGLAPKVGDPVLLIFCDQDISSWLPTTGATVGGAPAPQNQQILFRHDLNNAVAILGLINSSRSTSKFAYKAISTFALSGVNITASKADLGGGFSGALVEWIKNWEGLPEYALDWYDDGFGNPTIGYGHMNMGKSPAGGVYSALDSGDGHVAARRVRSADLCRNCRRCFPGKNLYHKPEGRADVFRIRHRRLLPCADTRLAY